MTYSGLVRPARLPRSSRSSLEKPPLCSGGCYHEAHTRYGETAHPNLHYCEWIRGWTETTPLPHAPLYVRGVINLRGAVVPILDLGNDDAILAYSVPPPVCVLDAIVDRQFVHRLIANDRNEVFNRAHTTVPPNPKLVRRDAHPLILCQCFVLVEEV